MLPMSMGTPQLAGPMTPEMLEKLHKIKYCVIGIFVAAVGRLCTGDVPFNELLCGINGIFLLKEDEGVSTCYACLASSPLGQCAGPGGGGLGCLMPFLFIASFNCVFLALRLFIGGPFLLLSFCFQFTGAVFAWRLNTLVSAAMADLPMDLGGVAGQGQPLTQPLAQMRMFPQAPGGNDQGGGRPAPGGGGGGGGGGGPTGPGGGRFVAFQGSGQRLGG